MKNLLGSIFLFIIISTASATEITFLENPDWNIVLEKARKENKMIFFDAYATWCGPCKMMDSMTYKDKAVADYYNANFINVKYDMEKGQGPALGQNFGVTAYPSLLFVSKKGSLVHKGVGFNEPKAFLGLGNEATSILTKFDEDKKNALQLSPKEFLAFANQAAVSRDEDLDQLYNDYLQKQEDILGNEYLIDLVMAKYATMANEKSLAYVVVNKAKISASGKYDAIAVEDQIVGLTLSYALSPDVQEGDKGIDYDAMNVILQKYIPERAFYVWNYFKIQYMTDNKKMDEALVVLDLLIANTPAKVSFSQLCNTMINMGPILAEAGKLDEPLKKFEAVKLPPADEKNAYMKDFVKAVIYYEHKDLEKFKVVANAIVANKNAPENVKANFKQALTKMQ